MLGFVGFAGTGGGIDRQSDWWSTQTSSQGPLPEASAIAVLLDAPFEDTTAINQIRVDLRKAFRAGVQVLVCVGDGVTAGLSSGLAVWLQSELGIGLIPGGPYHMVPATPELGRYFADILAHAQVGTGDLNLSDALTLAEVEGQPGLAASVRFRHENSDVIVLPVGPRHAAVSAVQRFLELLPPREPYPEYLDELDLVGELSVKAEIQELEKTLTRSQAILEDARALKRIMYLTDYDLEVEVVKFLERQLGIPARHVAGSDEDGWLQTEEGEDWAIVEVKGMSRRNVAKAHVADLMSHRHKAEKPDDFPGVLVASTFHRAETLEERDQPVERDVTRFAAAEHVLIVRTLDLMRLKKLVSKDVAEVGRFVSAIQEGGGWFEVDDQDRVTVQSG